jgi:hypothetical protein
MKKMFKKKILVLLLLLNKIFCDDNKKDLPIIIKNPPLQTFYFKEFCSKYLEASLREIQKDIKKIYLKGSYYQLFYNTTNYCREYSKDHRQNFTEQILSNSNPCVFCQIKKKNLFNAYCSCSAAALFFKYMRMTSPGENFISDILKKNFPEVAEDLVEYDSLFNKNFSQEAIVDNYQNKVNNDKIKHILNQYRESIRAIIELKSNQSMGYFQSIQMDKLLYFLYLKSLAQKKQPAIISAINQYYYLQLNYLDFPEIKNERLEKFFLGDDNNNFDSGVLQNNNNEISVYFGKYYNKNNLESIIPIKNTQKEEIKGFAVCKPPSCGEIFGIQTEKPGFYINFSYTSPFEVELYETLPTKFILHKNNQFDDPNYNQIILSLENKIKNENENNYKIENKK